MNLVQIKNGVIVQYNLPKTGELSDGRTVSGYDLLDLEILLSEGWLLLEDIQPEYDTETQYIMNDGYEILADKVIVKYRVENNPIIEVVPTEPNKVDLLEEQVLQLQEYIIQQEMEKLLVEGGM